MGTTPTLRLDLELILPDAPDEADACVQRLLAELSGRQGVNHAHIAASPEGPPKLCIHYDPNILSLARLRELVDAAGAKITRQFGHLILQVEGLRHARRARVVADHLRLIAGVLEAEVSSAGLVRVEFNRELIAEEDIRGALSEMDVQVIAESAETPAADRETEQKPAKQEAHDHDHGGERGWLSNTELLFALSSGVLLAIGYVTAKAGASTIALAAYITAYFFGGYFTVREAIDSLRHKRFEIDTLMLVAAAGAGALGKWAEGALLLFLFSIGHALEHYALGRARRAIEALARLAPETAEVRRDGETREIAVSELVVGDLVIVRPNVRIPADGFVLKGTSSVDQAPITGESVPVDKRPVENREQAAARAQALPEDQRIYAGTINGGGALEIEVTRLSTDTALARVVRMVNEAETQRSPTQQFTDRFERIFVPAVLGFVVLLLFAWVVVDEPFRDSFYRAMAVLVAASPCALAIATPSAVLSGVARAARGGVLIKGGAPLENLGALGAIAFDKTGTLTEGKPRLTDVVPAAGVNESELLRAAISIEKLSDHPLASAVVRDAQARLPQNVTAPTAEDVRSITGRGIAASIGGETIFVGKRELFSEVEGPRLSGEMDEATRRLEEQGRTIMIVRLGQRYLGVLGLMDTPREPAKRVTDRLRSLGITRMIMISGDNARVAEAVAKQVGIDEAWGNLMPEDKVAAIKKLRVQQKVAMVGDGVNDAPAMANATVGIAMGAAGSDVALETADVALMGDDLRNLPFVVGLSRRTSSVIRQNLWLSLGMVAFLIPATLFGLKIGLAVLFHEGSTLIVVANALRLLAFRDGATYS